MKKLNLVVFASACVLGIGSLAGAFATNSRALVLPPHDCGIPTGGTGTQPDCCKENTTTCYSYSIDINNKFKLIQTLPGYSCDSEGCY